MVLDALEGDGVSDLLLQWLHKRDELNYGPSLWLPDTVVYKFGQPVHWYFTGVDGKLKKKNKHNLVNVRIEEAFNKRVVGCDIIAYYISETVVEDGSNGTCIEYLDRKGLHDFLYNRWKENNGLLQRFVEPKGVNNAIIRAIWSPKICLLERRVNSKQLHDGRFGLYERAVTYEGPEHYSAAAPLRGSSLPSQIQRICENVVTHVAEVSFHKHRIVRMVANFKVDSRDRVWLLWTSSIRLSADGAGLDATMAMDAAQTAGSTSNLSATGAGSLSGTTLSGDPARQVVNIDSIVRLPPHVKLQDKANHAENPEDQALVCMPCVSCGKTATSDQFHPVQYKAIIAHFEQLMHILKLDAAQDGASNAAIKWPPDPMVIAAAGGVGFGKVQPPEDHTHGSSKQAQHKQGGAAKAVKDVDLGVPPVIRNVHPRLTLPFYRRYRKDPLFLYKTVDVCEDCFLVYAELANAKSLNSDRGFGASVLNATARSKGGKSTATLGSTQRTLDGGKLQLPKHGDVEAWQPVKISAARKRAILNRDRQETQGGFAPKETPQLPPPVFSSDTLTSYEQNGPWSSFAGQGTTDSAHPHFASEADHQLSIEDMVRKREEAFFRECATASPHDQLGASASDAHLHKGDPLTHLVTTFKCLQMHSHAAASMEASLSSQKTPGQKHKKSPYATRPVLFNVIPASGRLGGPNRANHTKSLHSLNNNSTATNGAANATTGGSTTDNSKLGLSQSSKQHRDFLMKTLEDVQSNIQTPQGA